MLCYSVKIMKKKEQLIQNLNQIKEKRDLVYLYWNNSKYNLSDNILLTKQNLILTFWFTLYQSVTVMHQFRCLPTAENIEEEALRNWSDPPLCLHVLRVWSVVCSVVGSVISSFEGASGVVCLYCFSFPH